MPLSRRDILKAGLCTGSSLAISPQLTSAIRKLPRSLKFGIITDIHIGFIKDAPKRFAAFEKAMRTLRPDAVIQMGDFAYPNKDNQKYVDAFNGLADHPIHAIGNHELDHKLTREDAQKSWGIPGFYYAKEIHGLKIIVLDGNDRGSPTYKSHGGYHSYIGEAQRSWLSKELETATTPVLIISHQPLAGGSTIDNAKEIQNLLKPHREKILLCLNGHSHLDQHIEIDRIHYLHINSASYFWLGGKIRTAFYRDPLFTTMTIDKETGTIAFTASKSSWLNGSPEEVGYFKERQDNIPLKDHIVPNISARQIQAAALE